MEPPGGRWFYPLVYSVLLVDLCVYDEHLLYSPSSVGTKSKSLTPQWDIMAKRVSEAGRPSVSLQDEVHELDWTLCGNELYYKPQWGKTHCWEYKFCLCNVWLHSKVACQMCHKMLGNLKIPSTQKCFLFVFFFNVDIP